MQITCKNTFALPPCSGQVKWPGPDVAQLVVGAAELVDGAGGHLQSSFSSLVNYN